MHYSSIDAIVRVRGSRVCMMVVMVMVVAAASVGTARPRY